MRRLRALALALALAAVLSAVSGCQHTVQVKTGTRMVDEQGRVVSEQIKTLSVPASEAGKYRIVTVTQESKLAGLYDEAQRALAAGDLEAAQAKLTEVVKISSSYRQAQRQLDELKSGKKVAADAGSGGSSGGSGGSTKPPPSTEPTASPTGLARWTPDTLTGFSASKIALDPTSVSRQYTDTSGSLAQLVIYAEQFRTATDAKKALTTQIKQRYPENSDTRKINGRDVYFGTDGRAFAVVGFTNRTVMIAIEALPATGKPSRAKGRLQGIVEQLP